VSIQTRASRPTSNKLFGFRLVTPCSGTAGDEDAEQMEAQSRKVDPKTLEGKKPESPSKTRKRAARNTPLQARSGRAIERRVALVPSAVPGS